MPRQESSQLKGTSSVEGSLKCRDQRRASLGQMSHGSSIPEWNVSSVFASCPRARHWPQPHIVRAIHTLVPAGTSLGRGFGQHQLDRESIWYMIMQIDAWTGTWEGDCSRLIACASLCRYKAGEGAWQVGPGHCKAGGDTDAAKEDGHGLQ